MVFMICFGWKNLMKPALTLFQLSLLIWKRSRLSHQDWTHLWMMLINSWTFLLSSQVAMLAAILTLSMSYQPVVMSLLSSAWKKGWPEDLLILRRSCIVKASVKYTGCWLAMMNLLFFFYFLQTVNFWVNFWEMVPRKALLRVLAFSSGWCELNIRLYVL